MCGLDTLVVSPQVISLSFVALSVIVLSNFQACLSRRSILAASFILPLKSPKRTPDPTPPHPTSLSLTPDNYNLLLAQAQTLQAPLVTISVSPQHRGRGSCSGEWWQLTQRSYGMEPLLSATPPISSPPLLPLAAPPAHQQWSGEGVGAGPELPLKLFQASV